MIEVNGHTKKLAIIGDPIEHTYSPQMHNFISEKLGNDYVYVPLWVKPDSLGDALAGFRAMNFSGMNVTSPHKYAVMQYLDEISEDAKKFGSVNTVVNRDGRLIGYNTDAPGFYQSLLHEGVSVEGKDIIIFGAGGATKPISVLFSEKGAKGITIINRTKEKADALAEYVKGINGFEISTEKKLDHYDIAINTTSVGMEPQEDMCPVEDMSFIDSNTAVVDMIYNPPKTVFLKRAEERGAKIINGLGMLIYQGIIAYELFTDTKLPEDMHDVIAKEVFGK